MRGTWNGLGLLGLFLLGLAGCMTTDAPLKPPPRPEEVILPPVTDARFAQPPTYPKDSLNQGLMTKERNKDDGVPNNFRSPGGRGGIGGGN